MLAKDEDERLLVSDILDMKEYKALLYGAKGKLINLNIKGEKENALAWEGLMAIQDP